MELSGRPLICFRKLPLGKLRMTSLARRCLDDRDVKIWVKMSVIFIILFNTLAFRISRL